ncbi:hypothetical protein Mapa_018297 [Marchantia paleacea]|nr:hypothetical protein Mapa_018234 [Marchantia paleacea]KAG6540393.1 hypothetical protein Mapa_018297 [Marchantia paleacea]
MNMSLLYLTKKVLQFLEVFLKLFLLEMKSKKFEIDKYSTNFESRALKSIFEKKKKLLKE